ncbi:MAG: lipopolysaccharide assembly protein LapB [Burkholderiaceae bacterium]
MEFQAWWLLVIPLFFGLGWITSRFDQKSVQRENRHLPDAYFKGLNFLLSEQSDKAIDAFIDVVRLDPDTIELHFALGNLFRRRGESDRAIRVHQNLIERGDLDPSQREHALFELGQDYLKAGLIDRAEDAFNRLEGTEYGAAALKFRLEIVQMVRDWPQAIELAERLDRVAGDSHHRQICHFHCELAVKAQASDEEHTRELAAVHLENALHADPRHPRPRLLQGQQALADGDPASAVKAFQHVAIDRPDYLALVAREWIEAHRAVGKLAQGIDGLEGLMHESASIDVLAAVAGARSERDGPDAALAWASNDLRESPSLLGLATLLQMRAPFAPPQEREEIALVQKLIHDQVRRLSRYQCQHCGFKARQFYWQCPGCNRWDTYSPRRSEELERA